MPYDHSSLSTFQACAERYRLKYQERLELITDTPHDTPLHFGKALHAGFAAFYKGLSAQAINDCFLAAYPKAPEGEQLYTPQHGLQTLQEYLDLYATQDKVQYKTLLVEEPITLTIGATEYLVKIDTVVESTEGIWVLEHKSTASKGAFFDEWWARFEPNSQVTGLFTACQQQFGRCDGVIINGISLSYGVRKGFDPQFQRQVFTRTEEQVIDWKRNLRTLIARVESNEDNVGAWEKNENMCVRCEFRPLCMSVGSQGTREAMFRQRTETEVYAYQQEGG